MTGKQEEIGRPMSDAFVNTRLTDLVMKPRFISREKNVSNCGSFIGAPERDGKGLEPYLA